MENELVVAAGLFNPPGSSSFEFWVTGRAGFLAVAGIAPLTPGDQQPRGGASTSKSPPLHPRGGVSP